MDEEIPLLKDLLPSFLVENRKMYSILSKSIHELSEEECLAAFNVVRLGIELILDEKIEKKEKERKINNATKEIQRTYESLKGSKNKI